MNRAERGELAAAETRGDAPRTVGQMAREARRIGHDLNNCIGIVSGRAELIQVYLDKGNLEGVRKGVAAILGQVERMRELSEAMRFLGPRD